MELIVAVTLFALLACLILPILQDRQRPRRRSSCLSNVRQISLAFKQYAVDNSGLFPTGVTSANTTFALLTNGNYLAIGKIYLCPSDSGKTTGGTVRFSGSNCSYSCVNLNNRGGAISENDSMDTPLVFDAGIGTAGARLASLSSARWTASPHSGTSGGNVVYIGGQAAFKKVFDTGKDGTNGVIKIPGPM